MSDILMILNNYTQALKERNALQAQLEQVTKERDLAIIDRQDSDQVAEEIAMRAGRVLQELKNWLEITIHPWCSDRLDEIIAMMDWTQSEDKP